MLLGSGLTGGEADLLAYELVHGAFTAVRALETLQMFGIDVRESAALAGQVRRAQTPAELDEALAYLDLLSQVPGLISSEPLAPSASSDTQGEQQIGFDRAAWAEMQRIAGPLRVTLLGEEDEYRGNDDGAAARGRRAREVIEAREVLAVADPLDGSNQAAGMGQRSGWACCAMVVPAQITQTSIAILLGDGRTFVCSDGQVRFSETTHPDRARVFYQLQGTATRSHFEREHWVIPAAKRSRIAHTSQLLAADQNIKWISPLGGNPGILAAMLGAGAVAAVQPRAYAWDHMAAVVLATAGFVVLSRSSSAPLSGNDLIQLLLRDLVAGRRTEAMYIGRNRDFVERLREADPDDQEAPAEHPEAGLHQ